MRRLCLLIFCATLGAAAPNALAASLPLGKSGEPIRLTVGFNPYMAPSSTLAIVHGKELWKRHLPLGSRVDLELGIRGRAIVRAVSRRRARCAPRRSMQAGRSACSPPASSSRR